MEKPAHGIPDHIPVAMEPFYDTPSVNAPVPLHAGRLLLIQDSTRYEGTGTIRMEWPPRPTVIIRMDLDSNAAVPDLGRAELVVPGLDTAVQVTVSGMRQTGGRQAGPPSVTCFVRKDLEFGAGENLEAVFFHLPNFYQYIGLPVRQGIWSGAYRAVMEAASWRVTLDQIHMANREFMADLKGARGHAITHIGKLERASGKTFDAAAINDVVEGLIYFLSFCRGNWVAPVLCVGLDASGRRAWEEWGPRRVERWAGVGSWFNTFDVGCLTDTFPGFMARWQDETWREPLRLALHWYIESNRCAGGVEGALILAQVAFEILSWTLFVEQRREVSKSSFKKKAAAVKLRMLLRESGIDVKIPESLPDLAGFAASQQSADGPVTITRVRNALVHPKPRSRKTIMERATRVRDQAWQLALWYLELVLLHLLGYQGKYSSRVSGARHKGDEVEPVPWAGP